MAAHINPSNKSLAVAAIVYLRVSTERQADSGLGREAQEARCRQYAEGRGWRVAGVHVDDGVSGTRGVDKRPGLAAAIAAVRATPGTVLLVHSVSRFARSQRDLHTLLDARGADPLPLVSATEPFDVSTAMGKAFVGMLGVIAALESDLASERTKGALAARKARGAKLGPKFLADRFPETAAKVRELYKAKGATHASVADELNRLGIPTARGGGGRWHATTVRRTLAQ
jgi:DNA invertase Pin-like site-specific DNA recombinase